MCIRNWFKKKKVEESIEKVKEVATDFVPFYREKVWHKPPVFRSELDGKRRRKRRKLARVQKMSRVINRVN